MYWPYWVLEIEEDADDATIRRAYEEKIKACPPEKDAKTFSIIQQAYKAIESELNRAHLKVFGLQEENENLMDLVPPQKNKRNIIPRNEWLKELKK